MMKLLLIHKLDGIDVRVEKLRQPLVNLRMDTSSMNDLLVSKYKYILLPFTLQ